MKKVYSHENRFFVWNAKGVLEADGIDCQIRNEYASGGAGDLSPFDVWPEIWVSDSDEARALQILAQLQQEQSATTPAWVCPRCGESNGGAFEFCWQCGEPKNLQNH